jgi:hypothetical protein
MKNSLLLGALLLLSPLAQAQTLFEAYKSATYSLATSRRKLYTGQVKVHPDGLVVKDDQGTITRFTPEEVHYIRTADNKRYVSASGFTIKGRPVKPTLVEVLDSGRVMVMRYAIQQYAPAPMGTGSVGMDMNFIYLIQDATEVEPTALPDFRVADGTAFREALAPYVESRPDLAQQLANKKVYPTTLPVFIHALNSGQPFVPPLYKY